MIKKENRKPAWKRSEPRSRDIGYLEVVVINNDVNQALKVLKNKISKEGILSELKRRRAYEKPSDRKRRERREAIKKARKTSNRKSQFRKFKKDNKNAEQKRNS